MREKEGTRGLKKIWGRCGGHNGENVDGVPRTSQIYFILFHWIEENGIGSFVDSSDSLGTSARIRNSARREMIIMRRITHDVRGTENIIGSN